MKIIIPGEPIPLARPRFDKRGHAYDCQKFDKAQVSWKMKLALREHNCQMIEAGALKVQLVLNFLPVGSVYEKNLGLWGVEHHVKRPDVDNLEKLVLDCGNGILWNDDSQIVDIQAKKGFSNFPCTIIEYDAIKKITMSKELERVIKLFSPDEVKEMASDFKVIEQYCEQLYSDDRDLLLSLLASRLIMFSNKWAKKLTKIQDIS